MVDFARRFLRDEGGATAIEYGLIASLIFLIALAAMQATGAETDAMYLRIETAIVSAINGA